MFFNLYISLFFNKMRFEETQRTRKEGIKEKVGARGRIGKGYRCVRWIEGRVKRVGKKVVGKCRLCR